VKFLHTLADRLEHTLIIYGGWGLIGIAALDSAGLSMPGVKDFLLIYLSSRNPGYAWLYAAGCIIGTVAGSFVIYYLGRTGARLLKRKPSDQEIGRAKKWLIRNDFLTVFVASMLPPPLPLKPILLGSGALRISPFRFALALFLAGAFRFGAEAWVGVRYGTSGETFFKENLLWISLVAVAFVLIVTLGYRTWRGPADKGAQGSTPATAPSNQNQG